MLLYVLYCGCHYKQPYSIPQIILSTQKNILCTDHTWWE